MKDETDVYEYVLRLVTRVTGRIHHILWNPRYSYGNSYNERDRYSRARKEMNRVISQELWDMFRAADPDLVLMTYISNMSDKLALLATVLREEIHKWKMVKK